MTDAQKVAALVELLGEVINSLEMTQYHIEDISEAANVVLEADKFHQQMLDILHSEGLINNDAYESHLKQL